MRYKAQFGPNEILDPVRKVWTPLSPEALRRLDARKYCCLIPEVQAGAEVEEPDVTAAPDYQRQIESCLFLAGRRVVDGKSFYAALAKQPALRPFMDCVREFHRLTDPATWRSVVILLS